jgi:hypothetical protein
MFVYRNPQPRARILDNQDEMRTFWNRHRRAIGVCPQNFIVLARPYRSKYLLVAG